MRKKLATLATLAVLMSSSNSIMADWKPDGPIHLWIGYGAGGGTDTQARTLIKEIEALRGWQIIPENKAGADGTVMSAQLKNKKPDGQTLGFAITTTFDFAPMNSENISPKDFTYITTTAGSQMAVLARTSSGWKTLEDVTAAASSGKKIVWANWGTQVEAGAEIVSTTFGFKVNHLRTKGGRGALNALVSEDANLSWGGGVQGPLVQAGELVILASAEQQPLAQAPNGKLLKDYGITLDFGYKYTLVGPAGMDDIIRDEIAKVIAEVLANPDSETRKFIERQYPPAPQIVQGDALETMILNNYDANVEMIKKLSKK